MFPFELSPLNTTIPVKQLPSRIITVPPVNEIKMLIPSSNNSITRLSFDVQVCVPFRNRCEYNNVQHQVTTPTYPATPDSHHVSPVTSNSDPSQYQPQ